MLAEAQEALAAQLGEPESAPVPLEGGITNRNYRLRWGGRDCVLRLPGKDTDLLGIDRRTECEATRAAAAAGVGPEVVAFEPRLGCLVTLFIEGGPVTAEELRGRIPELADVLRRIHAGPPLPTAFDPFAVVEAYRRVAEGRGGEIPPAVAELAPAAQRIRAKLSGPEHAPVPCHNDLLRICSTTASGCGSSTGSTPAWATRTSSSPTSRSRTSSRRTTRRRCSPATGARRRRSGCTPCG